MISSDDAVGQILRSWATDFTSLHIGMNLPGIRFSGRGWVTEFESPRITLSGAAGPASPVHWELSIDLGDEATAVSQIPSDALTSVAVIITSGSVKCLLAGSRPLSDKGVLQFTS